MQHAGYTPSQETTVQMIAKSIGAQWRMVGAMVVALAAICGAGYSILLPKVTADLRADWQKDDAIVTKTLADSFAERFQSAERSHAEFRHDQKQFNERLESKLDRLIERK